MVPIARLAVVALLSASTSPAAQPEARLDTELKVTWTGTRKAVVKQERGQMTVEESLTVTFTATSHATAPAGTKPWQMHTTAEPEDARLEVSGNGSATCTGRVDDKSGSRTINASWTWTGKAEPKRRALFNLRGHRLVAALPHLHDFKIEPRVSADPPGDAAARLIGANCALFMIPVGKAAASLAQIQVEAHAALKKDTTFVDKLTADLDDPQRSFTRSGHASASHEMPGAMKGTIAVDFTVRANQRPSDLEADPGPEREVVRGGTVELDGSHSRGKNLAWRWTFAPQPDCPEGTTFEGIALEGAKVRFKALCGLKVTLVVSDGSREARRSTTVTVTPRTGKDWTIEVVHHSDWAIEPPWPAPYLKVSPTGAATGVNFLLGENWCAYEHGSYSRGVEAIGVIHPHGKTLFGDWRGHGWTEEKLTDLGGPFHGWYFVKSARELEIARVAVFNKALHDRAPPPAGHAESWHDYNLKELRAAGLKRAKASLEAHEGMGAGSKLGHSQIMRDLVADPENDPRQVAEAMIDRDLSNLMMKIEKELTRINKLLAEQSLALDSDKRNDPTTGVPGYFPDGPTGTGWYNYFMGAP